MELATPTLCCMALLLELPPRLVIQSALRTPNTMNLERHCVAPVGPLLKRCPQILDGIGQVEGVTRLVRRVLHALDGNVNAISDIKIYLW